MIEILTLITLSFIQLLAGWGLLTLFRIRLSPLQFIALSMILGTGLFSLVPFLLQICFVPVTAMSVAISIVIVTALVNLRFESGLTYMKLSIREYRFRARLYELPFFFIISAIVFISVWRCYYLPPTPRDLTSGAEAIATYAVREHTLINSVFHVNLESTNNVFKPAFVISLQLIYKLAGFPFGQVWLATLVTSFIAFLYSVLHSRSHPILAGFLLLLFLAVPELYAYSFMVLFDYSNTIFLFLSIYFLFAFFRNQSKNYFYVSALLMALATYVRSETLILAVLFLPLILRHLLLRRKSLLRSAKTGMIFLLPSIFVYLLSITVYVKYYLPETYSVDGLIRPALWNPAPFFGRLYDMTTDVMFGSSGLIYYSYFFYFFLLVLIVDIVIHRKWNRTSRNWLYAVLVIYIGIPLVAHIFPLYDLHNSTKRGLFKIFPLMLLYMAQSGWLRSISGRLSRWESSASLTR